MTYGNHYCNVRVGPNSVAHGLGNTCFIYHLWTLQRSCLLLGLPWQQRKSSMRITMTAPFAGREWRQPVNYHAVTCFIGTCKLATLICFVSNACLCNHFVSLYVILSNVYIQPQCVLIPQLFQYASEVWGHLFPVPVWGRGWNKTLPVRRVAWTWATRARERRGRRLLGTSTVMSLVLTLRTTTYRTRWQTTSSTSMVSQYMHICMNV